MLNFTEAEALEVAQGLIAMADKCHEMGLTDTSVALRPVILTMGVEIGKKHQRQVQNGRVHARTGAPKKRDYKAEAERRAQLALNRARAAHGIVS